MTPKYAVHWKKIGRSLGISDSQLDILGEDYSGTVERCCNEMFAKWLDIDTNATWKKLLKAINGCEYL